MTDLWDLSPVSSPAATDRIGAATGLGAGGYSLRSEFAWRDANGVFRADGAGVGNGVVQPLLELKSASDAANNAVEILLTPLGAGQTRSAIGAIREGAGTGASVYIAAGGATVARFTSAGNFGVGTGSPAHKLSVQSQAELARFTTSTVRGSGNAFIGIGDPDGRKGWLGCGGANDVFYVMNDMNANLVLGTNGNGRVTIDIAGNVTPQADNAQAFGWSSARWSVLYAVTGTINTCDIRLKFYRVEPEPTAAEHAAVLECFDLFGFFQHLDSIAREHDGGAPARWHFGPKAQEVWTIFANHGLAAPLGEDGLPPEGSVPPAFLCFDEWGEETADVMAWWRPSDILGGDGQPIMVPCAEGEEGTEQRPTGETYVTREAGNIFGVRIDQLQSLMLVALNKERKALEERVAALEPEA